MSDGEISRVESVRLGALAGLAPMVVALASCGSEESSGGDGGGGQEATGGSSQATTSGDGPSETTSEATTGGGSIALESEVSPGSAVKFQDGGDPAVLVRLDSGDFAAYSAVCTHKGCTVAYNGDGGTLDCPCHGSVFDPSSGGSVVQGPAPEPLPEIPVQVSGGEVSRA
jgi:arsenite oxidase small subunit